MDYTESNICGFRSLHFTFEGKNARIILPNTEKNGKWSLKTEYADAFMDTEVELLKRGYCAAFIENDSRWGLEEDIRRKKRFTGFLYREFSLREKSALVGMSCGGLMAIKQAAVCPETVACLYLDAPVLNFFSCPCGFGIGKALDDGNGVKELMRDHNMKSISELLIYRDMPMHLINKLTKSKIPLIMVAGLSDTVVPYCENGVMLQKEYEKTCIPFELYLKPDCDHHPHGHDDVRVTADFIDKHYL